MIDFLGLVAEVGLFDDLHVVDYSRKNYFVVACQLSRQRNRVLEKKIRHFFNKIKLINFWDSKNSISLPYQELYFQVDKAHLCYMSCIYVLYMLSTRLLSRVDQFFLFPNLNHIKLGFSNFLCTVPYKKV